MQGRIPAVRPADILKDIDVVVHLAGVVPPKGDAHPDIYDTVNHQWTVALAKECKNRGIRLFFPSTSSIYDATDGALLREDTVSERIQGAYALAQFAAEHELRSLAASGLACVIMRFGSVFGRAPHTSFDRVINKFVQAAHDGRPLTIQKNGLDLLYPYTYVGDVVQAINFAIEHNVFDGQVYNIVSQNATMGEVVNQIRKHFPAVTVNFGEFGKAVSFGMDDSRIRAHGFMPQGNIQDGIQQLCDYLKNNMQS